MRVDGALFGGANVECVNYSLTKHAEEAAVLAAIADGAFSLGQDDWIRAIYVTAPPCGSCRQFLWEFSGPATVVLIEDEPSIPPRARLLSELMPEPFDAAVLKDLR